MSQRAPALDQRETLAGGAAGLALLAAGIMTLNTEGRAMTTDKKATYGIVGQMKAQPGQRDALLAILADGTQAMPGNLAYIIGADLADPDSLWITELWESKEAHAASLNLPGVQAAIAKGRPMIAGFGVRAEFLPG